MGALTELAAMIAWRIWTTYSESNKFLQSNSTSSSAASMKRVMLTIIESGAIYSTALLILLGVYVSKNEANVPLSDAVSFITLCLSAQRLTCTTDGPDHRKVTICGGISPTHTLISNPSRSSSTSSSSAYSRAAREARRLAAAAATPTAPAPAARQR